MCNLFFVEYNPKPVALTLCQRKSENVFRCTTLITTARRAGIGSEPTGVGIGRQHQVVTGPMHNFWHWLSDSPPQSGRHLMPAWLSTGNAC